jgi:hypothetical protein
MPKDTADSRKWGGTRDCDVPREDEPPAGKGSLPWSVRGSGRDVAGAQGSLVPSPAGAERDAVTTGADMHLCTLATVWRSTAGQRACAWAGLAVVRCCQVTTAASSSTIRIRVRKDMRDVVSPRCCLDGNGVAIMFLSHRKPMNRAQSPHSEYDDGRYCITVLGTKPAGISERPDRLNRKSLLPLISRAALL